MRSFKRLAAPTIFAVLTALGNAHADGFSVLYTFHGGSDGSEPIGYLVKDKSGNLYGSTFDGGGGSGNGLDCDSSIGCGTVFKLAPDGTETVLYAFTGESDGASPNGLFLDAHGDLYGATQGGGYVCSNFIQQGYGCGTAFEIRADGTFNLLHSFSEDSSSDGVDPRGPWVRPLNGYHYGVTFYGGGNCPYSDGSPLGCGTVYKIAKDGTETVVYTFSGGSYWGGTDGAWPNASPVADAAGNLYGTTSIGGTGSCNSGQFGDGCGIIYKLAPDGTETVLYNFTGGSDGRRPAGGLLLDNAGNLYGTTVLGGSCSISALGCGTVFKLAPDGTFTVLYAFAGGADGMSPFGGLVRDGRGDLFGTTFSGGDVNCSVGSGNGCGTVYEINPNGVEAVLHRFTGGSDGAFPPGKLLHTGRFLYGATEEGGDTSCENDNGDGSGCGTVFRVEQFP